MTAVMRAADRVAGTAPGWPRRLLLARRAELVFLLRGSPGPRQRQDDAMPTPRVIGGLDGQTVTRH